MYAGMATWSPAQIGAFAAGLASSGGGNGPLGGVQKKKEKKKKSVRPPVSSISRLSALQLMVYSLTMGYQGKGRSRFAAARRKAAAEKAAEKAKAEAEAKKAADAAAAAPAADRKS